MTRFQSLNTGTVLGLLFVSGLLFRVFLLRYRYAVGFDEVNYLKLGVSAHLHGLSALLHTYWSPFFPFVVSRFAAVFSDYELAGRVASMLAGALLVFPAFYLGRLVYGERTGRIAALFVAFHPPLAFLSTAVQTESLYMFLAATAVLFGWWMLKNYSLAMALLTGIVSGLLYLTRPEGIGFLFIAAVWVIAGVLLRLFLISRLRAVYLLVFLFAGFLVVSSPYLLFLKRATGKWTLSVKGTANLQMDTPVGEPKPHFHGLDPSNSSVRIDEIYHLGTFASGMNGPRNTAVKVSVKAIALKYIKNLYKVLKSGIPAFLTTLPLLFIGAGLIGRKWQVGEGKKNLYMLSFLGFYWFGVVPLFHINERYFTSMWPLVSVWIAQGGLVFYSWLKEYPLSFKLNRKPKARDAVVAASAVLALWVLLSFLPELGRVLGRSPNSSDYWADAVEQKAAGLWLKAHGVKSPVIMARNHAVSFYAGNYDIRESVTLPSNEISRVLQYARARDVDYLVLDERYKDDYAQLAPLLEGRNVPPQLKLIYEEELPNGLKTVIYEVLKEPAGGEKTRVQKP